MNKIIAMNNRRKAARKAAARRRKMTPAETEARLAAEILFTPGVREFCDIEKSIMTGGKKNEL